MSNTATIQVGANCTVTLDAENPVDLIKKAAQFTQLPTKCGHCSSRDLSFMHRTAGDADEYDYLHLKCDDCGAQCDLGQKKAPKGDVFFKHNPKDRADVKGGFYKFWEQDKASSNQSHVEYVNPDGSVADDADDKIPL